MNLFDRSIYLLIFSPCSCQLKTRRFGRSLFTVCLYWSSCMEERVMTVCHLPVCEDFHMCCIHTCTQRLPESNAQHLGSSNDWWVQYIDNFACLTFLHISTFGSVCPFSGAFMGHSSALKHSEYLCIIQESCVCLSFGGWNINSRHCRMKILE